MPGLRSRGGLWMTCENLRDTSVLTRSSLIIGILCIFASVIFSLTIPLIVGQAVDENWTEVSWSKLTVSALKVLGASLVSGAFLFLQRRILIGMSRHIEYDLRRDFYAHLVDQPLSFFQEHRIGDLMARASNDLAAVRQLAGPMIMYTLQTIFVVVLSTAADVDDQLVAHTPAICDDAAGIADC